MDDYINIGKKVLKMINNNGFEAYFVGEAVRNFILKREINHVEIVTNANIVAVKKIFVDCVSIDIDNFAIKLTYGGKEFYISSYVTLSKVGRKFTNTKVNAKNINEDLLNRDFTISAIAMTHSGRIIDPFNGYKHLQQKKIRYVGNGKVKFLLNPSLIIKAFSLMSELDFNFSLKTKRLILKRKKYLCEKHIIENIEEFKKIFSGQSAKKAIGMMNATNVDMVLPTFKKAIRLLGSNYKTVSFQDFLMMSFILNGKIEKEYISYIDNYENFVAVYDLVIENRKNKFDKITLFKYGVDICLEANRIKKALRYRSSSSKKISRVYKNLRIKSQDDLVFNALDIQKIISPKDYRMVDEILIKVAFAVVNKEIKNTVKDIRKKVVEILIEEKIPYNLEGFKDSQLSVNGSDQTEEDSNREIKAKQQVVPTYVDFEDEEVKNEKD